MKKICVALLLSVTIIANAQSKQVRAFLDKTISLMKEHAMNSKNVDWPKVTEEAYRLAANAKTPDEAGESITYLFKSMDDFHGSVRYKKQYFRWRKKKIVFPEIYKPELAKEDNKFFTRQLNEIGYLRVPTTDMSEVDVYKRSQALQDSLCKVLSKNPKGLIIDLRLNGGGNVFSMATGVSTVLPSGLITPTDEVRKDGFYRNSKNIYSFKQTCFNSNSNLPIAVIIGPYSASSAEALAIIFKYRPNTILIGEPTMGLITGVAGYKIDKKSHLNIAVSYMTDVKNNVYTDNVQPEIVVDGGDNFSELLKDSKTLKAIEWINGIKH